MTEFPARWNNTGGDVRVHLIDNEDAITPTDNPWAKAFAKTTPKCRSAIYHGGWSRVEIAPDGSVPPPYKLCDKCFPPPRLPVRQPEPHYAVYALGHYEQMQVNLAIQVAWEMLGYDPDHPIVKQYDLDLDTLHSLKRVFASHGTVSVVRRNEED